jgi:hypothetical protein
MKIESKPGCVQGMDEWSRAIYHRVLLAVWRK